jgi:hypothetical protein
MKLAKPIAFIVIFAVFISQDIFACSCGHSSIEDAFADTDAIFVGKVVAIEKNVNSLMRWVRQSYDDLTGKPPLDMSMYNMTITLNVKKTWKGTISKSITVQTPDPSVCCICGFEFEVGESYLVYANGSPLFTNICRRTKNLGEATSEISQLDALKRNIENKKK